MADENKTVHGNDKRSIKPQHIYKIFDFVDWVIYKFGISGSKLNKDGSSPRANSQVNQKNKEAGEIKFSAEVLLTDVENREKALEIEKQLVTEFFEKNDENPEGNKRPIPDKQAQNQNNSSQES